MIEKIELHKVVEGIYESLTPAEIKINELIDHVAELEDKLEHVHEMEYGNLTGEPLVSGENNEGQEVWKPL